MRVALPTDEALAALTLPELRALDRALRAAIAAAEAGGGGFEAAILADADGVSVTFTIPLQPPETEE